MHKCSFILDINLSCKIGAACSKNEVCKSIIVMMVGKQGSRHDEGGLKESVSPIVAQSVFYFYLFRL